MPQVLLPSADHKQDWWPRSSAQCAENEKIIAETKLNTQHILWHIIPSGHMGYAEPG